MYESQSVPSLGVPSNEWRVSIVDYFNRPVYETYVRPVCSVEDLRVMDIGLRYDDLMMGIQVIAPSFGEVKADIESLIRDKILVGHCLWNTLSAMGLSCAALQTRDLALYRPLRKQLRSSTIVPLQDLARIFLSQEIGLYKEDSMEMACAAMSLFRNSEAVFEATVASGAWPCDLPPVRYAQYFS
ncbi:hypothetical protein P691DRAFT_794697 [Macrolepiota fuliginosa MF-IS2]|uniref:Exonuclease domain-containing protein n=1 Tax=Macrolepiota fuliginosa MF-IS2 TaxID=1400762 RepID=A0A9P5XLA2_9AGAR|nr:hypothetical protein P691DRAFT_794697 [Macrolepiota fuliginosa MF-IS2]